MIRINLLGRSRPKATRATVPLEATLQYVLLAIALVVSGGALWGHYLLLDRENTKVAAHIQKQMGEKARLEQLKAQVDNFEKQKAVLQQRIGVIEALQRNRTGGQELLEAIANTVSRTDTLWLTTVERKGDGLTINGSAGSLDAVANYITQLKRSGYFQTVEIKESHQDESNKAVEIFNFSLTAQFGLTQSASAAPAVTGTAAPAPAANAKPAGGKAGNF
ncbi:MAG TPA: PilN domain-containing protein [Candidatus Acidoferrales bacterium]|jgi:Tfp pilus assembly protein PilN|nr:PilN domain-containing protein [Candidatus Acidoferrales bacterium]